MLLYQRLKDAWAVLCGHDTSLDQQYRAVIDQLHFRLEHALAAQDAQERAIAQATSNFQSFLALNDCDKRAAIFIRNTFPDASIRFGQRCALDVVIDIAEAYFSQLNQSIDPDPRHQKPQ